MRGYILWMPWTDDFAVALRAHLVDDDDFAVALRAHLVDDWRPGAAVVGGSNAGRLMWHGRSAVSSGGEHSSAKSGGRALPHAPLQTVAAHARMAGDAWQAQASRRRSSASRSWAVAGSARCQPAACLRSRGTAAGPRVPTGRADRLPGRPAGVCGAVLHQLASGELVYREAAHVCPRDRGLIASGVVWWVERGLNGHGRTLRI